MSFVLKLNNQELTHLSDDLKEKLQGQIAQIVDQLSMVAMAEATRLADERLQTRREKFKENLNLEKVNDHLSVLTLKAPAVWIDSGVKGPYDMRETLLKSGYKTNKDGKRYRSIPFDQAKKPTNLDSKGKAMVETLKRGLKAQNIPFRNIEHNADGSPKMGNIHRLNIDSPKPSKNAKFGQLHGLTVSQHKTQSGAINREFMTFRTISENGAGQSWMNPGVSPTNIMEDTAKFVKDTFEKDILPSLLKGLK